MSESLDQVEGEVVDDMRDYLAAEDNIDAYAMSDEEVLHRIDSSYEGGSAQFNRESTYGNQRL